MRIWRQRLRTDVVVDLCTAWGGLCFGDRWQRVGERAGFSLLGLLFLGCGPTGDEEQDLLVGLLVPLSTLRVIAGEQMLAGANLAAEEMEIEDGSEGPRACISLRFLMEDTEGWPEVAISKTLKLLEGDGVAAPVGPPDLVSAISVASVLILEVSSKGEKSVLREVHP